jgi:hypothetical protein
MRRENSLFVCHVADEWDARHGLLQTDADLQAKAGTHSCERPGFSVFSRAWLCKVGVIGATLADFIHRQTVQASNSTHALLGATK